MWRCKRCGKCCRYIVIPITGAVDMDTEAYLEAHSIAYETSMTSDGFKAKLIIPAVCKYLKKGDLRGDKGMGEYYCAIHEDKFYNCRLGGRKECEAAQKEWEILEEMKDAKD